MCNPPGCPHPARSRGPCGAKSQGPRRRSPADGRAGPGVLLWLQLCGKGVGGGAPGARRTLRPVSPEGCKGARGARKPAGRPAPSLRSARGAERGGSPEPQGQTDGRPRPRSAPTPPKLAPGPGGAPLTPAWPVGGGASSERPSTPGSCENCSRSRFPSEPWADPACRPPPARSPSFFPWAEASLPRWPQSCGCHHSGRANWGRARRGDLGAVSP